jgi:hypothetical protein
VLVVGVALVLEEAAKAFWFGKPKHRHQTDLVIGDGRAKNRAALQLSQHRHQTDLIVGDGRSLKPRCFALTNTDTKNQHRLSVRPRQHRNKRSLQQAMRCIRLPASHDRIWASGRGATRKRRKPVDSA